jgi:hypothetical protein
MGPPGSKKGYEVKRSKLNFCGPPPYLSGKEGGHQKLRLRSEGRQEGDIGKGENKRTFFKVTNAHISGLLIIINEKKNDFTNLCFNPRTFILEWGI